MPIHLHWLQRKIQSINVAKNQSAAAIGADLFVISK
jgi:hypothetical protein